MATQDQILSTILKVAKDRIPTPDDSAPRLLMIHHGLTAREVAEFFNMREQMKLGIVSATESAIFHADEIAGGGFSTENKTRIVNPLSDLSITATRTSRWRFKIEVESPPIYGRRFYWRETIDEELLGQRMRYIGEVLNLAKEAVKNAWFTSIQQGGTIDIEEAELWGLWTMMDERVAQTPRENEARVHVRSNIFEDAMLPEWVTDSGGWFTKTVWQELQQMQRTDNRIGGAIDAWLVVAAIHETWLEFKTVIEEGIDMAKGKDEMLWWAIEGNPNKLIGFCVSLNRSSHMVVYDSARRVYLQCQNSEQQFVTRHAKKANLTAKRVMDAPIYQQAKCEKYTTWLAKHQGACKGCKRIISNEEAAARSAAEREAENEPQPTNGFTALSVPLEDAEQLAADMRSEEQRVADIKREPAYPDTTSPDGVFTSGVGSTLPVNPLIPPKHVNERQEWNAKNGPIIQIQGPQEHDPEDYVAIAADYRAVADRLMERAEWFSRAAEGYDSLLAPSDAVREAEALLLAAKERELEDMRIRADNLKALLADGPPPTA